MIRWGMYRSLVAFAVLQGVSNLGFWVLAWLGKNYALLALVIAIENLSGGMGTTAKRLAKGLSELTSYCADY